MHRPRQESSTVPRSCSFSFPTTVAIVGAGPAGLYAARLLLLHGPPTIRVIVIEACRNAGGRTRMARYHDRWIPRGAGVVRARDRLLRRLCRDLRIDLRPFRSTVRIVDDRLNEVSSGESIVPSFLSAMKSRRADWDRCRSFRENAVRLLGAEAYHRFVHAAGYTDFERADVVDTVDDYGFEDTVSGAHFLTIPWNSLVETLLKDLKKNPRFHLILGSPVRSVSIGSSHRIRVCYGTASDRIQIEADAVLWTAPRPSWAILDRAIRRAAPDRVTRSSWWAVMQQVACQPFVRAYARAVDPSAAAARFPSTTHLDPSNPLQKIIPMGSSIYMVAYADNRHAATAHRQWKTDRSAFPQFLRKWMGGLAWRGDAVLYYYSCGTHYFRPLRHFPSREAMLRSAMNPLLGIYLCGEGLSRNQGWTEGALESALSAVRRLLADVSPLGRSWASSPPAGGQTGRERHALNSCERAVS